MSKHRFRTKFMPLGNLFKNFRRFFTIEQSNKKINNIYDIAINKEYKESTIERLIVNLKNKKKSNFNVRNSKL